MQLHLHVFLNWLFPTSGESTNAISYAHTQPAYTQGMLTHHIPSAMQRALAHFLV